MKKLLLILSLSLLLIAVYGQLPNSSFESWTSHSYDEPNGWQTGNHEAASLGLIPVTKTNGMSGFAVRMQTMVSNGDTAQAYVANGDPGSGQGGVPFAEIPTAITGYYRYSLQGNDSAIIIVQFKKNGSIISSDIFKIHGTGTQNTFTAFSFPLSNLAMTPDSVIIGAASSNLIDNVGVQDGSFMELDGIAFAGATTVIDNGDFETWTTFSNDIISGWETYGNGFARTSDSYDGNYAVSLTTTDDGHGNISGAGMTTGHNTQNGTTGGFPYTMTSDTLTGYYKYSSSSGDSGTISISLMNNGNNISGNGVFLPVAAQYTYFEIPFSSFNAPDTMRIDISSSKWPYSQSAVGSNLIIDHLQLKSEMTAGIKNVQAGNESLAAAIAFPNPATDVLHIRTAKNITENARIEIHDINGRLIMNEEVKITDSNIELPVSKLKSGRYYYRLISDDVKFQQVFTKE